MLTHLAKVVRAVPYQCSSACSFYLHPLQPVPVVEVGVYGRVLAVLRQTVLLVVGHRNYDVWRVGHVRQIAVGIVQVRDRSGSVDSGHQAVRRIGTGNWVIGLDSPDAVRAEMIFRDDPSSSVFTFEGRATRYPFLQKVNDELNLAFDALLNGEVSDCFNNSRQ